ncbi:MAG: hypothetical protein R3Y54_13460, partial [Eubacteriales bacterium]
DTNVKKEGEGVFGWGAPMTLEKFREVSRYKHVSCTGTTMSEEEFYNITIPLYRGTSSAWEDEEVKNMLSKEKSLALVKKIGDYLGEKVHTLCRDDQGKEYWKYGNSNEMYCFKNYYKEDKKFTVTGGCYVTSAPWKAQIYSKHVYSELDSALVEVFEHMDENEKADCFQQEDLDYMYFMIERRDKYIPIIKVYNSLKMGDLHVEGTGHVLHPDDIFLGVFDDITQESLEYVGDIAKLQEYEVLENVFELASEGRLGKLGADNIRRLQEKYMDKLLFTVD